MARLAVTHVRAARAGGLFEVGDAPVGGGELVFETDDAGGRSQGHVLVEQCADLGRQREVSPAVAALPARAAPRAGSPAASRLRKKAGCTPSSSAAMPMVQAG
jgi:hypothetical protein